MAFPSEHDRFLYTMRAVSGGIAGSGLIVFAVGALGLIRPVLRAISPITVAVNIAVLVSSLVEICWPFPHCAPSCLNLTSPLPSPPALSAAQSLALASTGFSGVMVCPHLGFAVIFLVILFSQYMRGAAIPLGRGRRWPVFELCPVLLGLLLSW